MRHDARRLRILTWHVHGSYLYYLTHVRHDFYIPVKPGRPAGYGGRAGSFPWPDNLHEVPASELRNLDVDCVLYQSARHYLVDAPELLSDEQLALPAIYLEHDPPREHPTDTRHPVDDRSVLLVHVTPFNALMWDSGDTPTRVIEHGVTVPHDARYTGELARGISVVNNLASRGRRLGADVLVEARARVPIDLVGMGAELMGGLGEVQPPELARFAARYRFFFNPIRYTSLGLAICEAMMVGMPIVGLATTELVTVVKNDESGWIDTSLETLIEHMHALLTSSAEARRLGEGARKTAMERFGIDRFAREWADAFALVTGTTSPRVASREPMAVRGGPS
ncbi:MAG TPA: glycosyltransferase [Gemmatimonadaceae bacterium]